MCILFSTSACHIFIQTSINLFLHCRVSIDEMLNLPPMLCMQVEEVVNGVDSIGLDKDEQKDGKQNRPSKAQKRRVSIVGFPRFPIERVHFRILTIFAYCL